MASTTRYYPKGYIGSEQAAVLLARLRFPEHWRPELISPSEHAIWDGLGFTFNAEAIDYLIDSFRAKVPNHPDIDVSIICERYCDFDYSMQELRSALHAGDLTAKICDEGGHFDFIQKEGWGGDEGFDILLRGVVTLKGGLTRLILLSRGEVEELARLLKAEAKRHDLRSKESRPDPVGQAPKRPSRPVEDIFREWRADEAMKGRLPTRDEDVAYMKTHGIGRERVRELRKKFPTLPRGTRASFIEGRLKTAAQTGRSDRQVKPAEK